MHEVQQMPDARIAAASVQRPLRTHDAWEATVREELRRMRRLAARESARFMAARTATAGSAAPSELRPV